MPMRSVKTKIVEEYDNDDLPIEKRKKYIY